MKQMLWDFCQNYAPVNNPQSEVETRIDIFLTGVRNASNMGSAEKLQSSAPSSGAQPHLAASCCPQTYSRHTPFLPSTPTHIRPILHYHSPVVSPPICRLHRLPIQQGYSTIHPSSATSPSSPNVCQCGREQ